MRKRTWLQLAPRRHSARSQPQLAVLPADKTTLRFSSLSRNVRRHISSRLIRRFASHVPGERLELSQCCHQWILNPSRLPFRHPGIYNVFKNSLPIPDFKYFSRILASALDACFSVISITNGRYARVFLLLPVLCCSILLVGLYDNPT